MSGGLVRPALRRPAGPQPASRARPQTAVRTPARQPVEARSRRGGRPLPPSTRERMEAAFGLPLDHVRLHTDAEAVELAKEHDAEALTIGRHIAFGPAGFQPGSEEGTRLLAHELAHVVQQDSGGGGTAQVRGPASEPSGPVEHEADGAAERVARGEPADVAPGGAAWTTRARIVRRARTGAAVAAAAPEAAAATSPTADTAPADTAPAEAAHEAHEAVPTPVAAPSAATPAESPPTPVEPGPELESEETAVLGSALDAAKQQVAARATRAPPHTAPPAAFATPRITPDPSAPCAYQVAPTEIATEIGASAREVEAVARGPPVPALSHAPIIQTKLSVSSPGDSLEREADAVAARVLRGVAPSLPAPGGSPPGRLQRALPPARGPPITALSHALPRTVASVVAAPGGGRPLDAAVRARIEPHLGIDLSHVRVRQGPDAAAAARDLQARAFVSGTTIFLAAGSSPTDLALMAHEATHVAQQQTVAAARTTLMRAVADFLPDVSVSDFIPGLDSVRSAVRAIPGYTLLTSLVGTDPLTGEPVTVSPEELIETLLTYGPFGTGVSTVLQSIDVLGEVVDFVSENLAAHDLTLARVQRDIDAAWDELSVDNGIAGNIAILERYVAALLRDVAGFVESIADRVLEIVRSVVAEVTESLLETPQIAPVWDLAKKVMHYDPLRGVEVEAPTVEIIADFLRLIGEQERLAQMEERGTLQQTADWLDTQLATFQSLIDELEALYTEAWAAIQPENLPDLPSNLAALAQQTFGYVQHVVEFEATLIFKILELIKQSLLGWLSEYAHSVPGFDLLTVIIGLNPFTGEPVERTAVNLIRGFITLMPGGAETYDQLAETGVIDQAAERIESEMVRLGISVELITGIFHGIWDTLTLDDLLDPIGAFTRILTLFGEPILRLVEFVIVVIEVVITLVLRLMNFPLDLLESVITNAVQAIDDIAADPVGFLLHMMEAVKLGFSNYFGNIVAHLTQGLVDWLFRGLGQLGIQLPTDFSLGSILNLVFQVLGLTVEHLWEKLAENEHIGPERVAMIREGLDKLTGAWAFIVEVQRDGLPAIWRFIADQLSGLWTTLLSMAMEWILTKIITVGLTKLLAFLDPTFIMTVVNGFIAFFNAVASAIEYFRDMLEILAGYVSTLAAVAAGNVVPGAQMIEQGLADATPVAIGFLAQQVGIGNIPDKIAEIIGSVRGVVDDALDWLIDQAVRLGQAALDALRGGDVGAPEEPDNRSLAEKEADVDAAVREADLVLAHPGVATATVRPMLPAIQQRYRLTTIDLVTDSAGQYHINVEINPGGQTDAQRLLSDDEIKELRALAERFAKSAQDKPAEKARFIADRDAYIDAAGVSGLRSGDIVERIGRPSLTWYANDNQFTILYGTHLKLIRRDGTEDRTMYDEIDALLLKDHAVMEVVSAKLPGNKALRPTDITGMKTKIGRYFDPKNLRMDPDRSRQFGGTPQDVTGVLFKHEGGSMELAAFQAKYSYNKGALKYVALAPDSAPGGQAAPGGQRRSASTAKGEETTHLTIGQVIGVTREQLRRLVTDEIGTILNVTDDSRPFP